MFPLRARAIPCALGAVALAASALLAATPASAAAAAVAAEACTVEGATLDWGFKESFRAYIDGSIANGEWTTADGASYATPIFTWSNGTAVIDEVANTAEVSFAGSVHFTGHDGLLDTTVANPTVLVAADGSATLLLDVSGPTMQGDDIDEAGVEFLTGEVDPDSVEASGDQSLLIPAPTLTTDGSTAFPNYEAGTAFDDVTVGIPATADCRVALAGAALPLWLTAGALLAAVAVVIAAIVAVLRRRKQVADA
jgi:hypothetical protein